MAIEPKNTREHIISLYGHVTGVKKDLYQIKNNHLKHMHEDIDKLGGKVDNCLLYTSPSPRDRTRSRMPSSA